jgi:hypothetical protein
MTLPTIKNGRIPAKAKSPEKHQKKRCDLPGKSASESASERVMNE